MKSINVIDPKVHIVMCSCITRGIKPPFHHDWERRVWGMSLGSTFPDGATLDADRHATERIPPALYLSYTYFERWLYNLTTTLLEGGLVSLDEVTSGAASGGSVPRTDAASPEQVDPYAHDEYRRDIDAIPRFKIGAHVKTGNPYSPAHTRLPRYAREKPGLVHLHHGAHVLPDANAHGMGECPTHLYTVVFAACDLWGPEASARDKVYLDIWECHLEPA